MSNVATLRRLYVYFILAVSLIFLAVGLVNLLDLIGDFLFELAGGNGWLRDDSDWTREQLSLYLPFVIIAGPVWLFHWWLAERSLAREGDAERQSTPRSLYLALTLAASFVALTISLIELARHAALALLGVPFEAADREDGATRIAIVIVAGLVWWFHVAFHRRDRNRDPLHGAAAWLPRLYLYGAAGIGAALLAFGAGRLLNVVADALTGTAPITSGADWWDEPLAGGLALALSGFLGWAAHWWCAVRLVESDDRSGRLERAARLRWFYLYGLLLAGAYVTLREASEGLESSLRWVFGVAEVSGFARNLRELVGPALFALPFALFALFHGRRILRAGEMSGDLEEQRRRLSYAIALLGLAFTAVGVAYLVNVAIDAVFVAGQTISASNDWLLGRVAWYTSLALIGGAVWLWCWLTILRRTAREPHGERSSTSRRGYLYLVLAGSLVALLVSVTIIVYQVLQEWLVSDPEGQLAANLATPVGVAFISFLLLAYHGLLLRSDLAVEPELFPGQAEEPLQPARLSLVLSGPADADLGALVERLRGQLPDEHSLEVVSD